MLKRILNYFTKAEILLWSFSVFFILISFFLFDGDGYLSLIASLIGVTSLIFNAKGNPFGQILIIIFSIMYAFISFSFAYYGEMITYLGLSAPMALLALISWLKNPYKERKSEVKVGFVTKYDIILMLVSTLLVTVLFYFILRYFNTENLIISTFSVTTSFIAVFLTYKRSPFFALAYALNDLVLMVLWFLATLDDISYVSVLVCFIAFLFNDFYSFYSWKKMQKRQIG